MGKFTPKAVAGVFLGYHLQPGGKWSGDYIVVELNELKTSRHFKNASLQRVVEVVKPSEYIFPLKKGYEANRNTIEGFDEGIEVKDFGSCPAPVEAAETEEREDVALTSSVGGITNAPKRKKVSAEDIRRYSEPDEVRHEEENQTPKEQPLPKEPPKPTVFCLGGDPQVYEIPGGHMVYGRFVQKHKNTKKPPNLWPEEWQSMGAKERLKAVKDWEEKCRLNPPQKYEEMLALGIIAQDHHGGSSSSSAPAAPVIENWPAMPTVPTKEEHRDKLNIGDPMFNACVARSVGKAEIAANKGAQAALDKEWDRLAKAKAWDETRVAEWSVIAAKHRANDTKAHIGRVFEICTEKGSEFPAGHPDRKYKGRSVYQGNNVRDEAHRRMPS